MSHYEQSINDLVLAFDLIVIDSGFAPGTVCKITTNDKFVTQLGARGDTCRTRTNDFRGTVEITLMSAAPINAALSAIHELDIETGNGAGVGPLLVKDAGGTSLFEASSSWIMKLPDWERGDGEAKTVTWSISCADLRGIVGGNG